MPATNAPDATPVATQAPPTGPAAEVNVELVTATATAVIESPPPNPGVATSSALRPPAPATDYPPAQVSLLYTCADTWWLAAGSLVSYVQSRTAGIDNVYALQLHDRRLAEAAAAGCAGVGARAAASDSRVTSECTKVLGLSTNNLQLIARMRSIGLEDTPEELALVSRELSAFVAQAC